MIPYDSIARAERVQTPLSPEMAGALALWYDLYRDRAPWKEPGKVKSLNLAALAAGEIARQVALELKWDVVPATAGGATPPLRGTGAASGAPTAEEVVPAAGTSSVSAGGAASFPTGGRLLAGGATPPLRETGADLIRQPYGLPPSPKGEGYGAPTAGEAIPTPYCLLPTPCVGRTETRASYLKSEFSKLMDGLRLKLEVGCAAGGMIVKPCPNPEDGHIHFDWAMDWGICPLAFDDDGNLTDVIIPDVFREGKVIYTRLERHRLEGGDVRITQRAFRSTSEDSLGSEVPLSAVERWAALAPEAVVTGAGGMLFGWFRVAAANAVDAACPMGASVYAKGVDVIREIDMQYSRLLWEFEGGELAVDVDPTALREKGDGQGRRLPKLNERLFRAVDTGAESTYEVFAPALRDASLVNGLNQLLIRFEDLTGLSRGTFSDANVDARTATELKIVKQRSYATVADNQKALEKCLRDVLRAMDVYATAYKLAPEGAWEASFEWDDSVLTDADEQLRQRLMLLEAGVIGKAELRQWYLGESEAQAAAALAAIREEQRSAES